jgi:membrane-bound lytic murein transglycosylase D
LLLGVSAAAYLNGSALSPRSEAKDQPATLWAQVQQQVASLAPTSGSSAAMRPAARSAARNAAPSAAPDSLRRPERLRQMERLYRRQADIAAAQARGDEERVTRLLRRAMKQLRRLRQDASPRQAPALHAVRQALSSTYRAHFGVPDTLSVPKHAPAALDRTLLAQLDEEPAPETAAALPLVEDTLPTDLHATSTAVDMTMNQHVRASIAFLLRYDDRYLRPWMRRSATYFPMIEHIFAEEGVPDELKYLALVESGLNPYAQSRAKAAGIWQFLRSTGRQYGLTVDPWVDERLDPEKSTRAAARHLKHLYERFGDWQLALAGYNCNPRTIEWALERARQRLDRTPTFWDIYDDLPEETRNYVPSFIATALIVSNPSSFDLERVTPGPRYAFDYVPVEGTPTLSTVARLAGADLAQVQALNPELRSDRVPPSAEPYYVRLPHGTYRQFANNYAALSPEERRPMMQHTIRAGETMGRVAERYHVTRAALLDANAAQRYSLVRVGEAITIPDRRYPKNAALAEETGAKPLRIQYSTRSVRPVTPVAPTGDSAASPTASTADQGATEAKATVAALRDDD